MSRHQVSGSTSSSSLMHLTSLLHESIDSHPFTFRWVLEWEPGHTLAIQGHPRTTLFFHQHHLVPPLFYPITIQWSQGHLEHIPSIHDDIVYRNTALPIDDDDSALPFPAKENDGSPLFPVLLMDAKYPYQVISLVDRIILYLSHQVTPRLIPTLTLST